MHSMCTVQFKTQAKEKFVEEEAKLLAPLEQVCNVYNGPTANVLIVQIICSL